MLDWRLNIKVPLLNDNKRSSLEGLHQFPAMFLPSHIHRRPVPNAGTGLSTSRTIASGEVALRIERPLVAVLDSRHLKDACSNCYLWLPDDKVGRMPEQTAQQKERGTQGKLSSCLGCQVMKYCSKVGLSC